MKLLRPCFPAAAIIVMTVLTTSCSLSKIKDDTVDYKSAGEMPPLEVPPDLVRPATDDRYVIPGVAPQNSGAPYATMIKSNDGMDMLAINDPFDRAWRRVGLALDHSTITIEDRDRGKGIYHVKYADSDSAPPGFFLGLFGKKKAADQHYQLLIQEVTMKSQVSVLDKDGKAEKSEAASHLLAKLYEQLK
jgi:uncharacterized lipoprotein